MFIIYFLITISLVCYIWLRNNFTYWQRHGIPHLTPDIPFGNIREVGKSIHISHFIEKVYYCAKNAESPIGGAYFFINPVVVPTDLEFLKQIFIKDFSSFHDRNLYYNEKDDPLSAHLVSLDGEKWRNLRLKLTPTFTSGKMKFMLTTITEVGNRLTNRLNALLNGNSIDLEMKELCAKFTTDVIGSCALGIECNSLNDDNAEFREIGRRIIEEPRLNLLTRLLVSQFPGFGRLLRIKSERTDATNFFVKVLKETIHLRETEGIRRNDLIDMMIDYKNSDNPEQKLTFNEIAAQAYLFFIAGFETSSTTLCFCLYELSLNNDVQDKVRIEIYDVLKRHNGELTYECIMEMKYVHQVIDETLRKYPPISVLFRKTTANYKVPKVDFIIKKNTTVAIPAYAIHYDPDIYPNPEKFNPDRFSPENLKLQPQCSYLSFGEGPRSCIGSRFGKLQTYIGLISLMKNYKYSPCDRTGIPMKFAPSNFILSPKNGIWLKVEKL